MPDNHDEVCPLELLPPESLIMIGALMEAVGVHSEMDHTAANSLAHFYAETLLAWAQNPETAIKFQTILQASGRHSMMALCFDTGRAIRGLNKVREAFENA